MKKLGGEDIKLLPLATIGVIMGVGEVIIKPLVVSGAKLVGRTALNLLDMAMDTPVDHLPETPVSASITIFSGGKEL